MPLFRTLHLRLFAVALSLATGLLSAAEPTKATRKPWTTSRVVGSPEPPPPYKVVRAFPNLKFDHPLLLTCYPLGDRLIVGEQSGVLYSFADKADAKAELFCDLRKELKTIRLLSGAKEVEAVYGLAFHPDFEKNRQCFVCYTLRGTTGGRNFANGTRVSRFSVTKDEPPRIDAASEEIIITWLQGGHNGGDLHFGPDKMLYISTGDAGDPNPPDPFNSGQDISDLLSSVLRIDVDRKDEGKNYAIPPDNPFVASKGARAEVWAYGFRNPWRMSFDQQTGELFVGDVGWELWESIHRVEKGGNYGWAAMEGPQPIKGDQIGPTPIRPPLIELPHTIACSITGGVVYHGKKFPELAGAYIFGDWETRRLWAARFEGDRTKEFPEIARPSIRFIAFEANREGELYFLDQEVGTLHTLAKNDSNSQNADFPTSLSKTGLFDATKDHRPAEGVIAYDINSRQWHDGAKEEHYLALPGDSAVKLYANGKPLPGMVNWHNFRMHFPKDAVLTRTLSLDNKRLETQLLHYDGIDWRGYTYAWRDDQTDADLVPADGAEKEIRVGEQTRVWQFQSRGQCLSCHSNQSEYALAFLPEQLNRLGTDGKNQLIVLTETGYIRRVGGDDKPLPPFDTATIARERKLTDPTDESQPLEARARAYLHANCGHCHSDHGGGSVPLRLNFPTGVSQMKALDIPPTRGEFSLPDAKIIKPGDPYSSTLYFRMAKFGRDRMPHIGSEQPDEAGLKLIDDWIAGMKKDSEATEPTPSLTGVKSAQLLARQLGTGKLKTAERDALLASVAKLPLGPTRDLFEGYLPADYSGGRKLGSNPRPKAILALTGNAERGETLFWSEGINCGKCHRLGERGFSVGPDLTAIGKLRPPNDLLESLLTPSRRIEPKYSTYLVQTTDGKSFAGVVVKRDDKSITLRENQDREIVLTNDKVEELRPARTSLMPDGQLAGLTPQEAADLLEYLKTRK